MSDRMQWVGVSVVPVLLIYDTKCRAQAGPELPLTCHVVLYIPACASLKHHNLKLASSLDSPFPTFFVER